MPLGEEVKGKGQVSDRNGGKGECGKGEDFEIWNAKMQKGEKRGGGRWAGKEAIERICSRSGKRGEYEKEFEEDWKRGGAEGKDEEEAEKEGEEAGPIERWGNLLINGINAAS